jgi:GTP-binding protein
MVIRSAVFLSSNTSWEKCPPASMPEYAFIGRSNVGKSSLINMLTNVKGLAKTSATPGKTQLINHFTINGQWYLADLPGYGFAKVAKTTRKKWEGMIRNYLQKRPNLANVFALIDVRVPPMASDLELINWLGEKKIPFAIVFTKTDKLTRKKINDQVEAFKKKLLETWDELPPVILTSSENKSGREEILTLIEKTNLLTNNS